MASPKKFLDRVIIPKWLGYSMIVLWVLLLLGWLYVTVFVVINDY